MDIARMIDHTRLKPDTSRSDIEQLCKEAIEYGFAAVCVPPFYVQDASRFLGDAPVKVATVVGFPMGYAHTPAKVEEVKRAVDDGADEIDVVINIAAVKSGNWAYIKNDITSTTLAAHLKGKIVKIILEIGLLEKEEILQLCEICNAINVDFVKTSTGMHGTGATITGVTMLRKALNEAIQIKASGGIRDFSKAEKLIQAGATRIGTSQSIKLLQQEV
ncbi:MAG: deoxyribose-phosphate aldolase [Bacteroidota bacterium]